MKKIIILFMITCIISSCHSQTKDKKIGTINSTKKNEDKLYSVYLPLMNQLLEKNDFKAPNHEDFKNKIIKHFGVDIDMAKYNDVFLERGLGFTAMNNERFIDTYQLDRGLIDGAGDAFADILKEGLNNEYNSDFVNYNKVLFNDDPLAISKLIKDSNKTEDIVVYLNYEKNNLLINFLIKNLKKAETYNTDFKLHLLWYNNKKESQIIRKKIISEIANKNPDFIFDLSHFLNSNKAQIKDKVEQQLIDETLAYLIDIELNHYDNKDLSDNKGYSLLNNFYVQNPKLLEKLKANNYYNYPLLNKYTQTYLLMSSENEATLSGRVIDPDGFTNLRKEKNSTSAVLEKVKAGEIVEILDNSDNWWLVVTKLGNKGYVYKTKIRTE
jgi:hypothetical protein